MIKTLIDQLEAEYGAGEPIFFEDITIGTSSKQCISNELARLCDNDELRRFDRGIYYIPDGAPFSAEKVIVRKYIQPYHSPTVGYYTGEKFMYDNHLISDMPECIEICTKVVTAHIIEKTFGGNLHVVLRKPRKGVVINDDNIPALQLLDLLAAQDESFFFGKNLDIVRDYIYNYGITPDEVMPYLKHYPDRVSKTLLTKDLVEFKFKTPA